MHIVLDANIIIAEGFGNSAQFRLLLSTLGILRHTLYIPKPAIEEVVAKFEEKFDQGINEIKRGTRTLSRLLAGDVQTPVELLPDKCAESTPFRRRLEGHFRNPLCAVLDYPNTSHEKLVMRSTNRRKPFKNNGIGYIDSLIWETTLELAAEVDSQVVLLSNNSRDFSDGKGNLHTDLIEELTNYGLPTNKVVLVLSLADFIKRYVVPTLPEDSWDDMVTIFKQPNFEEELRKEIEELCSQTEWTHEDLGFEREHEREEISFSRINDLSGLKVSDVRKVSEGRFILSLNVDLDCDLDVEIEGGEDDDFTYSSGSIYGESLRSELSLVVDNSDPQRLEIEILSFGL